MELWGWIILGAGLGLVVWVYTTEKRRRHQARVRALQEYDRAVQAYEEGLARRRERAFRESEGE